jgi:hypothetical protein
MTSRAAAVSLAAVLEQVGVLIKADEPDQVATLLAGLSDTIGTVYDAPE